MISDIDEYFSKGCGRCERFATQECSTRTWADGLSALRAICVDAGLCETVKWGHPCYTHADRNITIIGAHRRDFRLCFFNAALMTDPHGLLAKQGPNTQVPDMMAFTNAEDVAKRTPILIAYLKEAMGYAEAGIKPPPLKTEVDLPDEMVDAMNADPELADAFHALTPGRRKSYAIALNAAKKAETRIARISKFRTKIIAGKGATER